MQKEVNPFNRQCFVVNESKWVYIAWWYCIKSTPLDQFQYCIPSSVLTHLPPVPHACAIESCWHWIRWWLVACSAPSYYLNQCWLIVNWTPGNKCQWNSNRNSIIFIQESAFKIVVSQNGGHCVQGGDPLTAVSSWFVVTGHYCVCVVFYFLYLHKFPRTQVIHHENALK